MDIRRIFLYGALGFVLYSLVNAWQFEHTIKPSTPDVIAAPATKVTSTTIPASETAAIIPSDKMQASQAQLVYVNTDVLSLAINLANGNIVKASLLKFPESVSDKSPIALLNNTENLRYIANSDLFSQSQLGPIPANINFKSEKTTYELMPNDKTLTVTLTGETDAGIKVTKVYQLEKDNYLIHLNVSLDNTSDKNWTGYFSTQLERTAPVEDKSSMFHIGSYTGASFSNPGVHRYQKVSFKDMSKANLSQSVKGGWLAMQQHYFLTAWIPEEKSENLYYTRVNQNDFSIGSVSQPITLKVGQSVDNVSAKLYLGPENTEVLKQISPGLDMTVDYGFLWFISSLLFSLMRLIYSWIGNWGWAIVLVTVLIKLAFYQLSAKSYKSMAGMRKLQPQLQTLKDRFGDDKTKLSQETMKLYREANVNPLGGCLPILVQIPVFIALYWVLIESVELRQAPFIFWINDLAAADPFHVLPVIMGLTMFVQQRLNPAPPDPTQAKVMMFLPILFTGLFWSFPAGLVLYWIVNNTLSIIQQWVITRKYS